jgi:hypothetical protein
MVRRNTLKKIIFELEIIIIKKNNYNNIDSFNFLIIDSIPLIFSEFIHKNLNIAILDMSNNLKTDLRALFDKDIIKKIEEINNYD